MNKMPRDKERTRRLQVRLVEMIVLATQNDPSSLDTFLYGNEMKKKDNAQYFYDRRNKLVADAVSLAKELGYQAGYVVHQPVQDLVNGSWDLKWGVVAMIDLPTGQISWHMESPDMKYDGHSVTDKTDRIMEYQQRFGELVENYDEAE